MSNSVKNVFLSYSHGDGEFVERLAADLRASGVQVWWDKWEIKVGDSITDRIAKGIEAASYLAIVLSPSSISSNWVMRELNTALMKELSDKSITVLPVLIEKVSVPTLLTSIKYADFRMDYQKGLNALLGALGILTFPWRDDKIEIRIQTARQAVRDGRPVEANSIYEEILESSPGYLAALSGLANVRFHQQRYQEGINLANKAIRLDDKFPYAYYQRGLCYRGLGSPSEAKEDFKRAIELKPDFAYAKKQLSELESSDG